MERKNLYNGNYKNMKKEIGDYIRRQTPIFMDWYN
jgi:hypothetical protein